ncbi:MAG: Ig-like domain-containing protein [Bacteroidota bacterium]
MRTTSLIVQFVLLTFFAFGQQPTPLTTTSFINLDDPDVEPAYNYDMIPPVEADILDNPDNYTPDMDNRYFMSVFGPRHKEVDMSSIQYFDFHQGTDITWNVSHNNEEYTSDNPPNIVSMCDGVVFDIYNPDYEDAENTATGRFVTVRCDQEFAGNPAWGSIYIAYRHLDEINEDLYIGQSILQGTLIGSMGETGETDAVHLHMSVIRRNTESEINVHPMRIFDPVAIPHLLDYLTEAEITQLNYSEAEALFRIAIPYHQANLKSLKVSLPNNAYTNTYDFEAVSQLDEAQRDNHAIVTGLELFAYPFNRGETAYDRHWNKYDDGKITDAYPSSPENLEDFAPFLAEGLLHTPAYVLDVKVNDLPEGYHIEDLEIELLDIYGRGVRANGVESHGSFAWAMINSEDDDAEERGENATEDPGEVLVYEDTNTDAKDLELVHNFNKKGNQIVGLRFESLGLPADAVVTDATLQFRADASAKLDENELTNLQIRAQHSPNALAFEEVFHNLSERETSLSVVDWEINEVWTPNQMDKNQSVSITPLLQEVVDRNANAWTNASPLVLLFNGTGKRKADAFDPDGNSRKNAYVYIEYTTEQNEFSNFAPEVFLTNPQDGAEFETLDPITFEAVAFDANHDLQKVEFYVNDIFQGDDWNAPYTLNWQPQSNGNFVIKAVAIDEQGNQTDSYEHEIDISSNIQIQHLQIALDHDNHDVEEHQSGTIWKKNKDLELCYDSFTPSDANQAIGRQYVGLRFEDIDLPANAVVTNAYVQFTADETHNNHTPITIWGERDVHPDDFSYDQFDVSNRDKTVANTNWIPAAWNAVDEAGLAQQSADISSILQEIISLPDWQAGGDVVLILHSELTGRRTAISHDQSPAKAPKLIIEFTSPEEMMNMTTMPVQHSPSLNTLSAKELDISIKPNPVPTNQKLELTLWHEGTTEATVTIFSNAGQLMYRSPITFEDQTDLNIELVDYPAGFYWVKINTARQQVIEKVVVIGN